MENGYYDYFEYRALPILIAKALYDAGRADQYLKWQGNADTYPDCYYDFITAGLESVCDFWDCKEVGPYCDTRWFFSDNRMMDFYRLCRDWSRQRGIPLKKNPYMLEAEQEVREQMSLNSYCYDYRFSTKSNHRWASGFTVYVAPEFNQECPLIVTLAYLFDYYGRTSQKIRYEIWKYDLEKRGKILSLPAPKEQEAA